MKKNHTDITIVLDRSGSMASCAPDTIGGFNTFVQDQKKVEGTADFTLHQFDHLFETPIPTTDIKSVPKLTDHTFVPRGNTALLDAIGRFIVDTGKRLKSKPAEDRAEKVIFVIITDGYENASREYNPQAIARMIDHQKDKYKWEFVFLGADEEGIKTAMSIGVPHSNTMKYASNTVGTQALYSSTSEKMAMFRTGGQSSMAFDDEDRKKQKDAGA